MGTKLIHLRLSDKLHKEIQAMVKEFGFQSVADFLRESARKNLHEHELKTQIKQGKVMENLTLSAEPEQEPEEEAEVQAEEAVEESDRFSRRGLN